MNPSVVLKCPDCHDVFEAPENLFDKIQAWNALDVDPRYKRPFVYDYCCPNCGEFLTIESKKDEHY